MPRLARLEYAAPADAGATLTADAWKAAGGWSYRLRDGSGQDVLRARLDQVAAV